MHTLSPLPQMQGNPKGAEEVARQVWTAWLPPLSALEIQSGKASTSSKEQRESRAPAEAFPELFLDNLGSQIMPQMKPVITPSDYCRI